jgi:phenylpropionate dioxygenase-like ring-hydroxylating dioxygenase large terminal subunit
VAPSATLGAMVLHLHKEGAAGAKPRIDLEREADVDRCGALADYWYVACLSTELGRDKPLARTMFGVPMALFRDERGRARAVRDRCLHRGTALSEGVVVDGKVACPYHGWMYEGGGKCVHIPSLGEAQRGAVLSDVEHSRAGLRLAPDDVGCLKTFAVREQDGLVYVHPGNGDVRKDPFPVPFWNHPEWVVYYMVTPFQNGVTNLVENFMDVPHTVYVHAGWFRNAKKKRVPATVERVNGSVLVTYKQEQDQISGLGFIMNPAALVGAGEPMVHTDKYYVPNITRVDYTWGERAGFVITSQCTPIGPTESMVYTAISYRVPFGGAVGGKSLERLIHWYTRQVITQDTEIMNAQRKGILGGKEPITFASTEADLLHADIEQYRAWLLDGAKGDGPDDAARDIVFWI